MSFILTKRLARSLWRTKVRLIAVILMVVVGVFGGIAFGGYASNVEVLYDNIYADSEDGVNLPDIWVNLPTGTWSNEESQNLCDKFEQDFPSDSPPIDKCEPRLVIDGTLFHTDKSEEVLVAAVWHGIDEGDVFLDYYDEFKEDVKSFMKKIPEAVTNKQFSENTLVN